MAQHNDLGKEGEALALEFLRKNDFEILHCNWRYSRYEIDIIAKKQGLDSCRGDGYAFKGIACALV